MSYVPTKSSPGGDEVKTSKPSCVSLTNETVFVTHEPGPINCTAKSSPPPVARLAEKPVPLIVPVQGHAATEKVAGKNPVIEKLDGSSRSVLNNLRLDSYSDDAYSHAAPSERSAISAKRSGNRTTRYRVVAGVIGDGTCLTGRQQSSSPRRCSRCTTSVTWHRSS